MIHWQTSYDSIVLMKDTDKFCRLMETNETLYDSVVLTKDTGVRWGLPIDADQ